MITEGILKQFVRQDATAFNEIYKAYAPGMYGLCLRYTSCVDDAQEVLQESFIKVYEHAADFDVQRPIGAWIKTITIRSALNFLKAKRKLQLMDNPFIADEMPDDDQHNLSFEERRGQLLRVLNQLPDGYRAVFNLFVIDNLTHKEIAAYLGISEGTSKSQLAKSKRMIQQLLQNETVS